MARKKEVTYRPGPEFLAAWPEGASGNVLNGQGETTYRRASPMFWHPADKHPFGAVQQIAAACSRRTEDARNNFLLANTYPPLEDPAPSPQVRTAEEWTAMVREFSLSNEADLFGATDVKDHYIVEGYDLPDMPNVVMLGFSHDYNELKNVPSTAEDGRAIAEIGRQYARGTRVAYRVANWIRQQGFLAKPFPGPRADALLLIPAAVDAGLGELGKHGSLINRKYGSNLRLAGITTNMPLNFDREDIFGSDDFCTNCNICEENCPPGAISDQKQWVRGVERYYVDFDKCIPYFAEHASCAICIATCPWARPGIADNLVVKMARKREAQLAAAKAAE